MEQENNPYYMKPSGKQPTPQAKGKQAHSDRTEKSPIISASQPDQIQTPLEIPGVIGLGRYLEQRGQTMSWKQAKEKDAGRKGKKGGKAKKKKARLQELSALSSSGEEDAPAAGAKNRNGEANAHVVHHVNRDDGEVNRYSAYAGSCYYAYCSRCRIMPCPARERRKR